VNAKASSSSQTVKRWTLLPNKMLSDMWTDSGKFRRKRFEEKYAKAIEKMYRTH
jgi:hypothetical protein